MTLLFALAGCLSVPDPPRVEADRPQTVVMVVGCTLRADRLGAYGNERPTSAYIDRLAAEGALFEDMTANAPWTRPGVASLVTGRYPLSLGIDDPRDRGMTNRGVHPDVVTLAELFSEAGWGTVGATANPNANEVFGMAQGFDAYHEATGLWRDDMRKVPGEKVVEVWLDSAAEIDGPLFGHLVLVDTHKPFSKKPLQRLALGLDALLRPDALDRYDAAVRVLDDAIRQLDEGLAGQGREDRLLVLVGDHGEGLWHPKHAGKAHGRFLYDANLKVPWILHGPGVEGGRRIEGLAEQVDVLPTLAGLAEIEVQGVIHGDSRVAVLQGGLPVTGEERVYSETYFHREHKARWSTPDHVYIRNYRRGRRGNPRGDEELYLAEDGEQRLDLSDEEPAVAEALQEEMEALRSELSADPLIWEIERVDAEVTEQLEALGYVE